MSEEKRPHSVPLNMDNHAILQHILDTVRNIVGAQPHDETATYLNKELGYILTVAGNRNKSLTVMMSRLDGQDLNHPATGYPGDGGFARAYTSWVQLDDRGEVAP